MILPKPSAPFERLEFHGDSITIDCSAKTLILPTDNQNILPAHNEFTQNTSRCNLTETPSGGLKNSVVQDYFPGSLTIEGDGCYLQNTAGTYTGKTLGAGKLSETSSIVDSGVEGIVFCTADGVEYRPADNEQYLIGSPSSIIEEFKVVNISNVSTEYTITIRCPDSISSISLYNLSTGLHENISFTRELKAAGTKNTYKFSRTLSYNSSERLQLTITYESLSHTYSFSKDANTATGLQNLSKSFIALYDPAKTEIDFFHFTTRPQKLEYKQEADGTISQITLYPGNGSIYHGRITHAAPTRTTGSGLIPDCLNSSIEGSVTKFLQAYGMITDYSQDANITTWVVPAISDTKILPLSEISDEYLGDTISIRASPGEYTCASFVVRSDQDIILEVEASDLVCGENTISKDEIDIKVVKCWWQGGTGTSNYSRTGAYLTPELLLYDDTLIDVANDSWPSASNLNQNWKNYLKLTNGSYINISSQLQYPSVVYKIPLQDRPIMDAPYIKKLNVTASYNKQLWVTLHVPSITNAGNYTAALKIKNGHAVLATIHITLQVLPISLLPPAIDYCIYYRGMITESGSISAYDKTVEQYTAEQINMKKHGIINTTIYNFETESKLLQRLAIRQDAGLDNSNLFIWEGLPALTAGDIAHYKEVTASYGVTDIFLYGPDETDLNTQEHRDRIAAIHAAGGKYFNSQNVTQAAAVADILDIAVVSYDLDSSLAAAYHAAGHKIYSYANPQSVPEYPRTFRLNYGLLLWQNDYDGVMAFAYQQSFGDVWNDFDYAAWRDHCFTYPTTDGVIDTVQWEGFREAVIDMQYLATLQNTIATAKTNNIETSIIDAWLDNLKTTDLTNVNLDEIRSQIIDYILDLNTMLALLHENSPFLTSDHNTFLTTDNIQFFARQL